MRIYLFIIISSLIFISCSKYQNPVENDQVVDNYFPLYKGYQCSFNYKRTWHSSSQPPNYEIDTVTWNVTDSVNNDISITYFISEKMEGEYIVLGFAGNDYTYDTLSRTSVLREFNFSIEEIGDTTFMLRDIQYNENFLAGLSKRKIKTKYYNNDAEEIEFTYEGGARELILKKNVGITFYFYSSVGGNNYDEIEVKRNM